MIIVLATLIFFASFFEIVAAAPFGYEDECGFHFGEIYPEGCGLSWAMQSGCWATKSLIMRHLCIIYFAPSLVAHERDHRDKGAIFVLNIFLGWTLVGWVIALVWAMTKRAMPAN
jgi:hypothetical protein